MSRAEPSSGSETIARDPAMVPAGTVTTTPRRQRFRLGRGSEDLFSSPFDSIENCLRCARPVEALARSPGPRGPGPWAKGPNAERAKRAELTGLDTDTQDKLTVPTQDKLTAPSTFSVAY